jgi:uncharacterized protein YukE
MSRPAGEPSVLAAGSRSMAGAAGALRDVRGRLRGTTSFVVAAGSWKGPASEAFAVNGAGFQTGLEQAVDVLDQAAGALSELAARLEHAQAAWDRAQRLAAVVGVDLDPHGDPPAHPLRRDRNPDGGLLSPATAADPAASVVAGQAVGMAEAAEHEAAAARRVAASRLDQAGHAPGGGGVVGHGPAGARGGGGVVGHGPDRQGHEGLVQRAVGRVLEAGAEVATATHHLAAAAETRVQAAARLAATADDPAVRAAAGRVAQAAGRPMADGRFLIALPLVAPVLDFTASVSHGEPLPRALAGAIGGAVGADLGGRIGLAACGGEAAATQGAGLIVCPALTAVGGVLGAQAGKGAALHVYDKLAGPPEDDAVSAGPPHAGRSGAGTGARAGSITPGSRPESGG